MGKTTKAFVLAAAAVVVAAGVPLGINAWKNLLTDKRPYAERFEDCRRTRLESWVETHRGPNPEAALEKRWAEIEAECRAKVDP